MDLVKDQALRERFKAGDLEALAQVYRAYAPMLFAFLRRGFGFESKGTRCFFSGDLEPWQLENIVQEVFVKAFSAKSRASYDGLRPFQNYLFTIAKNTMIDHHRRGGREVLGDDAIEAAEGKSDHSESPEEAAFARELQEHITAFEQTLSPLERSIFQKRFKKGLSVELVARQLKCSEHRVKRTGASVKKRFFKAMHQHGLFAGYQYGRDGLTRTMLLLITGAVCVWGASGGGVRGGFFHGV